MANNNATSNRVPGTSTANQVRQSNDGRSNHDETPAHLKREDSRPEVSQEIKPKAFERSFSKTRKIVSDVFKLMQATVLKQVGIEKDYNKDPDSFKGFEHTHVFRTFDSDGKKHDRCCMTAGHFHDVVWEYDNDGKPVVASVSGPKVMIRKQIKGKWTQVAVAANDYDDHTHDINYLQSHEVEARTTNIEATKVIAMDAQKGANPGGVVERG